MRGHYRGDGGISFSVTGIARQSLEEQEPSSLKLANGAWATFMNETGDGLHNELQVHNWVGCQTKNRKAFVPVAHLLW